MKMTAWVLLPPFALIVAWELRGSWRLWAVHMSGTTAVAVSASVAWMVRNYLEYGNPTQTASSNATWRLGEPLQHSIFSYLNQQPVLEHFLLNFYGLIGWIGTGAGELLWFQLAGFSRIAFTIALLVVAAVLLWNLCGVMRRDFPGDGRRFAYALVFSRVSLKDLWLHQQVSVGIAAISVFAMLFFFSMKGDAQMNLRLIGIATILAVGAGACIAVLFAGRDDQRLFLYGLAGFMFFSFVVLVNIYEVYLLDGRLRATHGRYFYPVIPWLLISLCLALGRRAWGDRVLMLGFALLAVAEVDAYINQVLPFVGGGAR